MKTKSKRTKRESFLQRLKPVGPRQVPDVAKTILTLLVSEKEVSACMAALALDPAKPLPARLACGIQPLMVAITRAWLVHGSRSCVHPFTARELKKLADERRKL